MLVALGANMFAGLGYVDYTQLTLVGALVALFTILSDMFLTDRRGDLTAFAADTVVSTLVIRSAQTFLPGSVATWGAAFATGLLVGFSEILVHRWVDPTVRRGIRLRRRV